MGPKKIKVGPFFFKIKYANLNDMNRGDSSGYTVFENRHIYIEKSYDEDLQSEILLHEILHVIWWIAGIKERDDEESIIRMESPLMLGVLRDNPDLVNFLLNGNKS